jgi:hypothetical protein
MTGEWITHALKRRSGRGGPLLTRSSRPGRPMTSLAGPAHRKAKEDKSMAALPRGLVEEGLKKKGAKP